MNTSRFLINLDLSKINNKSSKRRERAHSTNIECFPSKLHKILKVAEQQGKESIVSWQPDGMSFIVYDQKKFVEDLLPSFFRQTKYKSFQRQLNLYDFQRIESGPLEGSYFHDKFIRGREDLCNQVVRQNKNKKSPLPTLTQFKQPAPTQKYHAVVGLDKSVQIPSMHTSLTKLYEGFESEDKKLDFSKPIVLPDIEASYVVEKVDKVPAEGHGDVAMFDNTWPPITMNLSAGHERVDADSRECFEGKHFHILDNDFFDIF